MPQVARGKRKGELPNFQISAKCPSKPNHLFPQVSQSKRIINACSYGGELPPSTRLELISWASLRISLRVISRVSVGVNQDIDFDYAKEWDRHRYAQVEDGSDLAGKEG